MVTFLKSTAGTRQRWDLNLHSLMQCGLYVNWRFRDGHKAPGVNR